MTAIEWTNEIQQPPSDYSAFFCVACEQLVMSYTVKDHMAVGKLGVLKLISGNFISRNGDVAWVECNCGETIRIDIEEGLLVEIERVSGVIV